MQIIFMINGNNFIVFTRCGQKRLVKHCISICVFKSDQFKINLVMVILIEKYVQSKSD